MIVSFTDVNTVTRNTTTFPISIDDVKSYAKYFRKGDPLDISQDAFIDKMITRAVHNWENETGFLLLDQTFNTSLYNQVNIFSNFKASITRLNVRSFGDIYYYPKNWNGLDVKSTLATDTYFFTEESGRTPAIFQLQGTACLSLYPVYNNLELDIVAGYENNDFTNMPQDIKDALAMMTADIIDVDNDICGCDGFYSQEIHAIYKKFTIPQLVEII